MSGKEEDEGLVQKPMRGSFQRVGDQMAEEMSEKSPTGAVKDDLGSSDEPTNREERPAHE